MFKKLCQIKNFISFEKHLALDPTGVILSLRESDRLVLDALIAYKLRFPHIPIAQGYIALRIGMTRETVNRSIKRLVDLGALNKDRNKDSKYRWRDLPCTYILNPILARSKETLLKIKDYMPKVGKYLLFAAIMFAQQAKVSRNVTLKDIRIKKYLTLAKRKTYTSKRDVMSNSFSTAITNLPINLTNDDKKRLSQFTDEAILYALEVFYPRRDRIEEPVEYMVKHCRNFHLERNIPFNTSHVIELVESQEDKTSQMVMTTQVNNEQVPEALSEFRNIHKHQQPIKQYATVQDDLVTRSQGEDLEEVKRKLLDNQDYVNSCKILGIEPTKIPNAICLKS